MINQIKRNPKKSISKQDILNEFYTLTNNKPPKIGIEIERFPIDKKNKNIPYINYENIGIKNLLEEISENTEWKKIYDDNVLIGLKKENSTITLEPGCQVEISTYPQSSVQEIKKQIQIIDKEINPFLKKYNITLFESGIPPKTTFNEIEIFPKKRYLYMSKYLKGKLALSMMKETAGIQVNIDYENEEDAIKKLRIFTKISPVMTAIFSNSPYKNKISYKSKRALSWLYTDESRCGLISPKLFDKNYNFTFKDYIETVLNVPMLYISRQIPASYHQQPIITKKDILINGKITFNEFLKNGFLNYTAELKDYEIQQSLFFPEVRLKKYLEIRNHDCQKGDLKYSIPAIYKGLAYNKNVLNMLIKLFEKFSYEDILNARNSSPQYGLNGYFGDTKILNLAKEIINLAKDGLKNDEDIIFIKPIEDLILKGKSPADMKIFK